MSIGHTGQLPHRRRRSGRLKPRPEDRVLRGFRHGLYRGRTRIAGYLLWYAILKLVFHESLKRLPPP
jgi:hypothetical protein